jgi:hypothetical protein
LVAASRLGIDNRRLKGIKDDQGDCESRDQGDGRHGQHPFGRLHQDLHGRCPSIERDRGDVRVALPALGDRGTEAEALRDLAGLLREWRVVL